MMNGVSLPVNRKKMDSTHDGCDKGSSISCENVTESTSNQEEEKEYWIEHAGSGTREADEKTADIQHRKLDRHTEETEMASSHAICHTK